MNEERELLFEEGQPEFRKMINSHIFGKMTRTNFYLMRYLGTERSIKASLPVSLFIKVQHMIMQKREGFKKLLSHQACTLVLLGVATLLLQRIGHQVEVLEREPPGCGIDNQLVRMKANGCDEPPLDHRLDKPTDAIG